MEARERSLPNAVQSSFELPHQILTSTTYPHVSDDGTTCVVYGHSSGLRVLWTPSKTATSADDGSMHDTGGEATPPFADIPLDKPVSHISCPVAIPSTTDTSLGPIGKYLRDHIVVAVACVDNSTYLVSCSAALPSNGTSVGLSVLPVSQASAHGSLISSISLTCTVLGQDSLDTTDKRTDNLESDPFGFLLATASSTGSDLLHVYSVPVPDQVQAHDELHGTVIHRQFLNAPLSGSSIRFSPATHSSPQQTILSITIPTEGTIKLVEISNQQQVQNKKTQRNESLDTTAASAQLRITLRTGYTEKKDKGGQPCRTRILDAPWIMDGRAILVLLETGQFGIWDIDAIGPNSNSGSKGLIKGESNISGISGGSTTKFSLLSAVPDSSVSSTVTKRTSESHNLAPGRQSSGQHSMERGLVHVGNSLQSGPKAKTRQHVILQYNEQLYYIPNVQKFWQSEVGQRTANPSRLQRLPSFIRGGDPVNSIAVLSTDEHSGTAGYFNAAAALPDLVICTSHRILISRPRMARTTPVSLGRASLSLRPNPSAGPLSSSNLFTNKELDIKGLDEVLNNMGNSQTINETTTEKNPQNNQLFSRSRMDEVSNSPSEKRTSRSKLKIANQGKNGSLFR